MAALLFDLDGTLVDSGPPVMNALNRALSGLGMLPLPMDQAGRFIGPPFHQTLPQLMIEQGRPAANAEVVLAAYRRIYAESGPLETEIFGGVLPLLDALAGRHRLAVVTSKPNASASDLISSLGLAKRFEFVEGPRPESPEGKSVTLGRALERIGQAALPVMIGDRRFDIEAAQANRITSVGVQWGHGDRAELQSAGADHIVGTPAELGQLIDSLIG
jgi:phosphoglycolate phosphatase